MHSSRTGVWLLLLGGMLALGLVVLVWAAGGGSTQAQQGAMHNCPQAGKWSIAVWNGPADTDTQSALGTCATTIDAAFTLDPDTQLFGRYFRGRPEVSNVSKLDEHQGVLALGGSVTGAAAAEVEALSPGQTDGQMVNCPQASKWSIAVWDGPADTDVQSALDTCATTIDAAFALDPDTQLFSRFFRGRPEVSNLSTLDKHQGVLALGGLDSTSGPAEHRIGIRVVDGVGEFYDRVTNEKFVPRGADYHLFVQENDYAVDTLFSPAHYDPVAIGRDFREMRDLGYNVLRTFIDLCGEDCIGDPSGGISSAWLDNIADFLHRAKEHRLYVILTSNDLPLYGGYAPRVEAQCCSVFDGYMNTQYLSPVGLDTYREYWQEVVHGLVERNAPLDAIFAYTVRNEQFLFTNQPPLSLDSGFVTTANGRTYDMSSPEDKQRMLQDGLVYWIDQMRSAVLELDPTALVTVGLFAPNEPHRWRPVEDGRYVVALPVLARSSADFFDFHLYPGQAEMAELVENFGMRNFEEKPIILGEFGGFKYVFRSPVTAASGSQAWQVESCEYGFDGWMHWHWEGRDDAEIWTGSEDDGAINEVLAPANRPDPCETKWFDFLENNIALDKPVSASQSLPQEPPSNAVDGWMNTSWTSGEGPPQWAEIDLEEPTAIGLIRLVVSQYPDGETVHQIWGAGPEEDLRLLHEFSGYTTDSQTLEYKPPTPLTNLQIIRIVTLESPSWVAWAEIEILASEERGEW